MGSMHTNLEEYPNGFNRLAVYFTERVKGGVGLIITGGIAPNTEGSVADGAAKLTTEAEANQHKIVTDAVHAEGGKIVMQILHTGRYAYHPKSVAPSPLQAPISFFKPRELTHEDILSTIQDFVTCALLAKQAGYDGVEIMGSEGYLINQFLAPKTNHRQDEWGGSYDNRKRLATEIVSQTRAALGPDFIIIYRISLLDLVDEGSSWEEVVSLAQDIEAAGADIFNSGIGWHEARIPTIASSVPRQAFAWVTSKLKKHINIPIIAVNRINMPEIAESIISDGDADLVSLARPLLADPEWVNKAAKGQSHYINTCIACNQACLDHTFALKLSSCLVNPRACHETELNYTPTEHAKKIAVVGAGPAGLAFAHVAAMRGHEVHLFDGASQLGGQFLLAKNVPGKEEYAETIRFYASMMDLYGVKVHLNTYVDQNSDLSLFDEIVLSNGIIPRKLDISGYNHSKVVSYIDVLSGKVEVGNKVAIIGAGGIGFDVATYLVDGSHDTDAILEYQQKWGIDPNYQHRGGIIKPSHKGEAREIYLLKRSSGKHGSTLGKTTGWIHKMVLANANVKMMSDVSYNHVDEKGLHISHQDNEIILDVDHVIVCAGQESNRTLYNALHGTVYNIHLIGGADEAGELDAKRAIHQACTLASKI
jgi:2,4-dienoyl-CoA reductase (NADPH2)